MYCRTCGKQIADSANFCEHCGAAVDPLTAQGADPAAAAKKGKNKKKTIAISAAALLLIAGLGKSLDTSSTDISPTEAPTETIAVTAVLPLQTDAPTPYLTTEPSREIPIPEISEVPTQTPEAVTAPTATLKPTSKPTDAPTPKPTSKPTEAPTPKPTSKPTEAPTPKPTSKPTDAPATPKPTSKSTDAPSPKPTSKPTDAPTPKPTSKPTDAPVATLEPTQPGSGSGLGSGIPEKGPAPTAEATEKPQTGNTSSGDNFKGHYYATATGSKYHYENPCGNGTYYEVTWDEVVRRGLGPCGKCVKH